MCFFDTPDQTLRLRGLILRRREDIAALFFYLQRSHLAWSYGQIALADARGRKSPMPVDHWLTLADGWDTWVRYQTGCILLTLSFAFFGFAVAEALECVRSVSPVLSLLVPTGLTFLLIVVRWYVLTKFVAGGQPLGMGARRPRPKKRKKSDPAAGPDVKEESSPRAP